MDDRGRRRAGHGGAVSASGQKATPAEIAEKMSGNWKLNRELSPGLAAPARGGTGGPGRGGAAFMIAGGLPQRGGGGGGGGGQSPSTAADLPPDVLAAQAAMRDLQQIAETVTIKATVDSITVPIRAANALTRLDGKSTKLTVGAGHDRRQDEVGQNGGPAGVQQPVDPPGPLM